MVKGTIYALAAGERASDASWFRQLRHISESALEIAVAIRLNAPHKIFYMHHATSQDDLFELRLLVEELVCHVLRLTHEANDGVAPGDVCIQQEVPLGTGSVFADIHVTVPSVGAYFAEVKLGYTPERLLESLRRKFTTSDPRLPEANRLVLVYDLDPHSRPALQEKIRALLPAHWALEVWDMSALLQRLQEHFGIQLDALTLECMQDLRAAVDRRKGEYAFGAAAANEPLEASLLWQFSPWRLREMFAKAEGNKRRILEPASYPAAVVVFADLCGFSGYVRDTPRGRTIQTSLSAFCSKARHQIINDGGMLYQFLGDAVIGIFGVPDQAAGYESRSFECARALLEIGASVSNEWQRRIDRLQPVQGAHIGMAIGEMQFLSLRPFSRTHLGIIGDAINMAARLSSAAQSGEIVMSNSLQTQLPFGVQQKLRETEPIEAKNVGRIKAWRFASAA